MQNGMAARLLLWLCDRDVQRFASHSPCSHDSVPTSPLPEEWIQPATRAPVSLLRRVKVWCVQHEVSMQEFIAEALRETLRRPGGDGGGRPR